MRTFLSRFSERALDVMSAGAPVEPLLREFAVSLQAELPGTVIGINVLDKPGNTFRLSVFPGLPLEFSNSLVNNRITGKRGSCGMAIMTGRIVEVPEVASDERFSAEWKELFRQHGLEAMLSIPAMSIEGLVQGSLAVIHPLGSPPNPDQRAFLQLASALCAKICIYSRTQESTQILIGEMDHRMRNLFATIGGVAIMTMRGHPEPRQFRKVLDERLVMMQRAHSLAMDAQEVELSTLLRNVLSPYCADYDILFSGPPIVLAGEAASALALVIHELATNAAKYGALSQPGGVLHVRWATEHGMAGATFTLNWAESNGPAVKPPSRKGYGTTMITGSLRNAFDGAAELSYEASGFTCRITAPLTSRLGQEKELESLAL
ncbi:HWE histidine kinase domain-containing protein [Pseudomonas sp. MEJ086]|uniref:histidine kinase n=2 Tax=Pseudomonas fulva TaxID=47880 RepID=A0A0D0KBY4_9PSED|nr:HWE histidine kinase domain-containing protein [Pseudomonas sp. MEJ086]KIQ06506.1 chemotaxis protein CheR [Pseudomonas fulva]